MCGFVGLIDLKYHISSDHFALILQNMVDKIFYRGPDDCDIWLDCFSGIGLAHRRLSVIDLTEAGRQPMISQSRRFIIVYNGEVYNHNEIRKKIEVESNIQWVGHSDTEVILAAFEQWGIKKTLNEMTGMYAIALWDTLRQKLILARDRMGEKPLYYGTNNNLFFFGSDLNAFCGCPMWKPAIDTYACALFMKYGYIPGPFSIYRGIKKLPPGTFIEIPLTKKRVIETERLTPTPYWSFLQVILKGIEKPFDGDIHDIVNELDNKIVGSIKGQLIADVPVGCFLSGGIDSSLIAAVIQASGGPPVKTFSVGFKEKAYDESGYARKVANFIGAEHREIILSPEETIAFIPDLPKIYSEPFGDVSALPMLAIAKFARRKVTVCLSGDGGDELFWGYSRYLKDPARWSALSRFPLEFRRSASKIINASPMKLLDVLLFWGELFRSKDMKQGSLSASFKKLGKELCLNSFMELYDFRSSAFYNPEMIMQECKANMPSIKDIPQTNNVLSMSIMDALFYLPDDILVKVDRAAMFNSLETRVPLLDHSVVEFAASLPSATKIRDGKSKWILKQLLYKYVPRHLTERPKMGFGVPVGKWLRGPLREWAEDLLDERSLNHSGFNSIEIRKLWDDHLAGYYNHEKPIWNILMFQAWQRKIGLTL